MTECGNGVLDPPEECELNGVGCTSTCTCDYKQKYVALSPPDLSCTVSNAILDNSNEPQAMWIGIGCSTS